MTKPYKNVAPARVGPERHIQIADGVRRRRAVLEVAAAEVAAKIAAEVAAAEVTGDLTAVITADAAAGITHIGTAQVLAGVHAQPIFAMTRYGLIDKIGEDNMFGNIDDALNRAREIVGEPPKPAPLSAVPEVGREAHGKDPINPASSAA